MRRRLVVVCVFSPQKLDERSVVSKIKKEKYHIRSCVVSRDVVKTVGKKKKMQKNTQPTKKEPFCSVSPPPPPSIYTCALVSEAPAEEKNHSLYLLKRQSLHEKRATMKRLFGVKKTVEAPSLEDTTSKVRLLSRSLFLALALALFFSLAVCARARVCVVNLGWVHLN